MRVKRGVASHKKHHKIRKATKGMTKAHRSSIKRGKQATTKALQYAYRDRRNKKRSFRRLWQVRINAAVRPLGLSYSRFMDMVHKAHVELDRKTLSNLAMKQPAVFEAIVTAVKK